MSETTAARTVTFLPTHRRPALPGRRDVARKFHHNGLVTVDTRHPDGPMNRGRIRHLPSNPADGALGRWQVTDYDGHDLGVVVGDYLDAEDLLLEGTCELDADSPTVPITEEDPWNLY